MTRRRQFNYGKRKGEIAGNIGRLLSGGESAGKVLTIEGEDAPLPRGITIDLATEGKKSPDGKANFVTREADPMRPFAKPAGPEVKTFRPGQTLGDMKRETMMSHGIGAPLEEQAMHQLFDKGHSASAIAQPGMPGDLGPTHVPAPPFAGDVKVRHGFTRQEVLDQVLKSGDMPTHLGRARDRFLGAMNIKLPNGETVPAALMEEAPKPDSDMGWAANRAESLNAEVAKLSEAPKLSRVQESCFHKLIGQWRARTVCIPAVEDRGPMMTPESMLTTGSCLERLAPDTGIFLLQHDWAAAFSKAADYEGGEIALPYPMTVFECRINGFRFVLPILRESDDESPLVMPHYESQAHGGWAWLGHAAVGPDFKIERTKNNAIFIGLDDLVDTLLAQVRAVLIALEAEAATADVVRAPFKLNQKRERQGKLPIFDFHVINLAARKKYPPRLSQPFDQDHEHRHKRLHFVRGHFRHYENHKTWVKWHLRGDPDLGFVDKEYRL